MGAAFALSLLTASSLAYFRPATTSALDSSWSPPCPARAFASGRWVERDPAPSPNASVWASTGFTGCAQNWFKNDWHLGLLPPSGDSPAGEGGVWPMSPYRRRAGAWEWQSEHEVCAALDDDAAAEGAEGEQVQGVDVVRLLQDLVDRGAWLIVGGASSFLSFLISSVPSKVLHADFAFLVRADSLSEPLPRPGEPSPHERAPRCARRLRL